MITRVSKVHYCGVGEDQTACGRVTGGRPMAATHRKEQVTCAQCKENLPVEYRYLNMDTECITTADKLRKYAEDFPGGMHCVVSEGGICPVLQAYGRKRYEQTDVTLLYKRLSHKAFA